jgi:hypothetical protein
MGFANRNTVILFVVIAGIVAYFLITNNSSSTAVHNEGSLTYSEPEMHYQELQQEGESDEMMSMGTSSSSGSMNNKFRTRDTAPEGTYKHSSYAGGNRENNDLNNLDKFFESVAPLEEPRVNGVMGFNEDGNVHASYKGGSHRKLSDDDKFNASELLPKEHKYDWFDDSQATPVANTHLINISRPQGVNTILSKRYGVRDVRGIIPNPRNLVSPWNMSSVEPDMNIKTGALC